MTSEAKIQQEIFVYFHNTYPKYICHSVPNGVQIPLPETERARILSQMHNVGMINGISDLIIHLPSGKCVMVEVKNEKGVQSEAQKKIEAKIKAMGGNYILVRSLEDFQNQIKQFL